MRCLIHLLSLASCIFVSAQKPHEKCEKTYKKIGCFDQQSSVAQLFTDRASQGNKGHVIDWNNFAAYLHSLSCRCSTEAKARGFKYFYLRYYGICYGGNEITQTGRSSACQTKKFKRCIDGDDTDCVGVGNSDYIYEIGMDGGYGEWESFSVCSKTCGNGIRTRSRTCTNPAPRGNGKSCAPLGPAVENMVCKKGPCAVDGKFSSWTSFSKCTKSCGGGFMSRQRVCNNPAPANGGKTCSGPVLDKKACGNDPCPVDGKFSSWTSFSKCTKSCGGGFMSRQRICDNPAPANGGKKCSGPVLDKKECGNDLCQVDGKFSSWTSFSKCTKSCGGGFMSRQRVCDNPAPANGGKKCSGPVLDKKACVNDLCPGSDGLSKAEKIVETFLVNFYKSTFPTKTPSGKFHQAIFAIQQAVANDFALGKSKKTLQRRLDDLRKFLKAAANGDSIDFARALLGKSLFVFMKKKIKEGLAIDNIGNAAKGYLESIKKDIGSKRFGELMLEKGDTTLMFAIDTTGSMADEINAAKGIANYIINMPRKFPVDYVLSPFNDPGHGPVTRKDTAHRSEFVTSIQHLIARGGGDCPELSFTGMIDALKVGPKLGSPMFVFTDASAKDDTDEMRQQLKDAASQYSATINFFTLMTGCGGSKGIKSYEEIADYTSGQIFPLLSHTELLKFKDFVKNSLKSKSIIAMGSSSSSATGKRSMVSMYKIQVDSEVLSLIVSLSVKQVNAAGMVHLTDQSGNVHSAQSSTPYTKVYNVEHPTPGPWTLVVPTYVGEVSFIANAVLNNSVDFEHHFLHQEAEDSKSPVLSIPNPLIGKPASLVLRISNAELLRPSSLKADVINEKGVVLLSNVALRSDSGGAFKASINPPSGQFKILLSGLMKTGEVFQRISHRLSQARKAFMMVISAGDEFTASLSAGISNFKVYAYNQGAAERFTFGCKANYGSVAIGVSSKLIQRASNATISFRYMPWRSAASAVGKTETIIITAKGYRATRMQISVNMLIVP